MKTKSDYGERVLAIRPDWVAYFHAFCEAHGGSWNPPVRHRGRLLFCDGWMYSSQDHAGPEWAPPEDEEELRLLLLAYWSKKRLLVRHELRLRQDEVTGIKQMQSGRGAELQQRIVYVTENEEGLKYLTSKNIDLSEALNLLVERVHRLEQELRDCDLKITTLKNGARDATQQHQAIA